MKLCLKLYHAFIEPTIIPLNTPGTGYKMISLGPFDSLHSAFSRSVILVFMLTATRRTPL